VEKINIGRVVAGGLVAGLVMNVSEFLLNAVVMAKQVEAAMQSINRPAAGGSEIARLVALTFLVGIGTVWLYAAIRPRFGAGVKTALTAGLTVWALTYFYNAAVGSTLGLFPASLTMIGAAWELVATLAAAVAGCAIYREAVASQPQGSLQYGRNA
jgi:hypothetical protein